MQRPTLELHMTRLVAKNKHQKYTFYDENGPSVQKHINNSKVPIVDTVWKPDVIASRDQQLFTLTSYNSCISSLFLKLRHDSLHDLPTGWDKYHYSTNQNCLWNLEVPIIRPKSSNLYSFWVWIMIHGRGTSECSHHLLKGDDKLGQGERENVEYYCKLPDVALSN